jgi:hypothetical protein
MILRDSSPAKPHRGPRVTAAAPVWGPALRETYVCLLCVAKLGAGFNQTVDGKGSILYGSSSTIKIGLSASTWTVLYCTRVWRTLIIL